MSLSIRVVRKMVSPSVLVSMAVFVLLWLWVGPERLYVKATMTRPMFLMTWPHFLEDLRRVGGFSAFVGEAAANLHYLGAIASAVLAAVCGLVLWSIHASLVAIFRRPVKATWFIPAALMAVALCQYEFQPQTLFGAAVSLLALLVYVRAGVGGFLPRLILLAVLVAVAYVLAGGAALVLVAGAALGEVVSNRRWALATAGLVASLAVILGVDRLLAEIAWFDLPTRLLPEMNYREPITCWVSVGLLAYLPLVLLAMPLVRMVRPIVVRLMRPRIEAPPKGKSVKIKPPPLKPRVPAPGRPNWALTAGGRVAGIAIVIAIACFSTDRATRFALTWDVWALDHDWNAILAHAREVPRDQYSLSMNMDVNRALYAQGRLADEMFAYPQRFFVLAGFFDLGDALTTLRMCEIYLDMGRINEAEVFAGTSQSPQMMQRLVLAKRVKLQPEAARVYVRHLESVPFQGRWVGQAMQQIQADQQGVIDPQIAHLRSLMPSEDVNDFSETYTDYIVASDTLFRTLLQANPRNRMAFEYMMAAYLIRQKFDDFIATLPLLDNFQTPDGKPYYTQLPRHYEEAVLLYQHTTGKSVDLGKRSVRPETVQRFKDFLRIVTADLPADPDEQRSQPVMDRLRAAAVDYRDTYFYYFRFGPAK
jgi:hypothetical protein